jgi:hypothetical protein
MTKFVSVAASTVLAGSFIPAHDQTFDIAESIGTQLDEFRAYVASARDADQADNAVAELLTAFREVVAKQDHTFRVIHERSGRVAYEGESYMDAAKVQYTYNSMDTSELLEPLWRLWLVDVDGIGVIVNTQQPTR